MASECEKLNVAEIIKCEAKFRPNAANIGEKMEKDKEKVKKKRKHSSVTADLKSDTVPLNDVRRSYPRIFSTMMNRCQTEDIAHRLKMLADPSFLFVIRAKDHYDDNAPCHRELQGVDCAARYLGSYFQTCPDSIFVMKDVEFFKMGNLSQIHCQYEFTGSIVYALDIQQAKCTALQAQAFSDSMDSNSNSISQGKEEKSQSVACDLSDLLPASAPASSAPVQQSRDMVGLHALAHVAELFGSLSPSSPLPPSAPAAPAYLSSCPSKERRVEAKEEVVTIGHVSHSHMNSAIPSHSNVTHFTSPSSSPSSLSPQYSVVANEKAVFSLGGKLPSPRSFHCTGQVFFYLNHLKRVTRIEMVYSCVSSPAPPSVSSLPSTRPLSVSSSTPSMSSTSSLPSPKALYNYLNRTSSHTLHTSHYLNTTAVEEASSKLTSPALCFESRLFPYIYTKQMERFARGAEGGGEEGGVGGSDESEEGGVKEREGGDDSARERRMVVG